MLHLFLVLIGLLTIFLSGGVFFKGRSLRSYALAAYVFLFGVEILYFIGNTSDIYSLSPHYQGWLYFSIGLLYGPILLLHFRAITRPDYRPSLRYLWHFLPLIATNLYMLDIILLPTDERLAYLRDIDLWMQRIFAINIFRALQQLIYGLVLVRIFMRYDDDTSTKFYLGGISIMYLLSTIVISLLTFFAGGWTDFQWYYLLCTILLGLIAYVLYREPVFFQELKTKYENSKLSQQNLSSIAQRLSQLMTTDQPYLLKKLSTNDVADQLGITSHQLSQTLSAHVGENFNDYINRHRIEHAKKLLRDPAHDHLKIEAIGIESGFNTRVTFYKAFSKWTGTTPAKYRQQK